MAEHNIEIEISKTGEVKVHVKGVKGPGCLEYGKLLAEIVGKVKLFDGLEKHPKESVEGLLQQVIEKTGYLDYVRAFDGQGAAERLDNINEMRQER